MYLGFCHTATSCSMYGFETFSNYLSLWLGRYSASFISQKFYVPAMLLIFFKKDFQSRRISTVRIRLLVLLLFSSFIQIKLPSDQAKSILSSLVGKFCKFLTLKRLPQSKTLGITLRDRANLRQIICRALTNLINTRGNWINLNYESLSVKHKFTGIFYFPGFDMIV